MPRPGQGSRRKASAPYRGRYCLPGPRRLSAPFDAGGCPVQGAGRGRAPGCRCPVRPASRRTRAARRAVRQVPGRGAGYGGCLDPWRLRTGRALALAEGSRSAAASPRPRGRSGSITGCGIEPVTPPENAFPAACRTRPGPGHPAPRTAAATIAPATAVSSGLGICRLPLEISYGGTGVTRRENQKRGSYRVGIGKAPLPTRAPMIKEPGSRGFKGASQSQNRKSRKITTFAATKPLRFASVGSPAPGGGGGRSSRPGFGRFPRRAGRDYPESAGRVIAGKSSPVSRKAGGFPVPEVKLPVIPASIYGHKGYQLIQ